MIHSLGSSLPTEEIRFNQDLPDEEIIARKDIIFEQHIIIDDQAEIISAAKAVQAEAKKEIANNMLILRRGAVEVFGEFAYLDDQDTRMRNYLDPVTGENVHSRRLKPEEQKRSLKIAKEA